MQHFKTLDTYAIESRNPQNLLLPREVTIMDRVHWNRLWPLAIAIGMAAIGQCGRQERVDSVSWRTGATGQKRK